MYLNLKFGLNLEGSADPHRRPAASDDHITPHTHNSLSPSVHSTLKCVMM